MDIKPGDYTEVKKHEGCKHGGTIMKSTPHIIDGEIYPKGAPEEQYFCTGRTWIARSEDVIYPYYEFCPGLTEEEIAELKNEHSSKNL